MRVWIGILILSISFSPSAWGADSIRVRLFRSVQSVQIKGTHIEAYVDGMRVLPSLSSDIVRIQVETRTNSSGSRIWLLRWNEHPRSSAHFGSKLHLKGISLKQGRLALPRNIEFVPVEKNGFKFDLISSLSLETYIVGVLPKEMPASWPLEALKAQSVAARSFAVARINERRNATFHVETSVVDQVFEFSPAQMKKTKWSDHIQKAVQSTAGEVLMKNGSPIKAYYHADCGGRTELASHVWGGRESFNGAIKSCYHPSSSLGSWSFEINREDLAKKLKAFFNLKEELDVFSIRAAQTSPSGRVKSIAISFLEDSLTLSAQKLRQILGFDRMKSTMFQIESTEDKVILSGQGHGHGVGMCQYGAKTLAENEKTYREILKNYFPNTKLKKLSDRAD